MNENKSKFPGEKSKQMLDELGKYIVVEPYPFVVDLEKSRGMYLCTVDGQRLFDWCGGYATRLLGYNHPALYDPEYTKRLVRAANNKMPNPDLLTQDCLDYYRLIYKLAPKCMANPHLEVYAINSGAEANENMLKYFTKLHNKRCEKKGIKPQKRRLLYFDSAFHGRTVFVLNVTNLHHDPLITNSFHGFIKDNVQMPFPYLDNDQTKEENEARARAVLDQIKKIVEEEGDEIIGLIAEPMQGAGGQRMPVPGFFRELSIILHDNDIPFGFDEVQTSGGQTGTIWACDLLDLAYPPQAVSTAKKFGNGIVFMRYPMDDVGVLDSTWGGNLTDMVRFMQEWKVVENEKLIEQVPAKEKLLVDGLKAIQKKYPEKMANIRGWGLYQGFDIKPPYKKGTLVECALEEESLFLLGAGPLAIRLRPALDVTQEEIKQFLTILERLFATLQPE